MSAKAKSEQFRSVCSFLYEYGRMTEEQRRAYWDAVREAVDAGVGATKGPS